MTDFESCDLPDLNEYLATEVPRHFVFGAYQDGGYIFTLSANSGRDSEQTQYDIQIAVLAELISQLEADSERSAEEIFRDLVEKRNERSSDRGDSS